MSNLEYPYSGNEIAVIGMSGRFPQSADLDEFWSNLVHGKDCITHYSTQALKDAGVDFELLQHPNYVKAKGEIGGLDAFDAAFFGINPKDAQLMDPQHRMMLECAWSALEHAGYNPKEAPGKVGVYVGKSMSSYLFLNLYSHIQKMLSTGNLQAAIGNDKDSLATTISYRLNLKGPSMAVQSSSSTSLVSVCMAVQSLLTYQCDMALAGGITVGPPERSGYLYEPGGIMSSDGHCWAFDERSSGFVPGNGYGLVVLKRLDEALREGDHIWSIIKGYAVNNDGSQKMSYTAPSVDAQAEVIAQAQALAEVDAATIGYVEAHGTGTRMGDPIEIQALSQAFRHSTDKSTYCPIGSVKTNIGHLDSAAGIAGFIKTTLMLHYKQIPPSLHYRQPNSKIDFDSSPFYVNTRLQEWKAQPYPRRAGVNSLGMGGTNAHVILEEAPERVTDTSESKWNVLLFSSKEKESMQGNLSRMRSYMQQSATGSLDDVAYTLATGRQALANRSAIVCSCRQDAVKAIEHRISSGSIYYGEAPARNRPFVFMFTGQGAQYSGMGAGLYADEPVYRECYDRCAALIFRYTGMDIQSLTGGTNIQHISLDIHDTVLTQPLLFAVEYALARLLISKGVQPQAMIGHSLGEYVAAAVAGVFSLEDALHVVCRRAEWMMGMERGAMIAVGVPREQIDSYLQDNMSVAAVNSPQVCVVSGSIEVVETLEKKLKQEGVFHKRLTTSHAFHSPLMRPMLGPYRALLSQIEMNVPSIPIVSCLTGSWLEPDQAISVEYWTRHITEPVLFMNAMEELLEHEEYLFVEVGPGTTLCGLARQTKAVTPQTTFVSALRSAHIPNEDSDYFMQTLAQLWVKGGGVNWNMFYSRQRRYRIPLPTYAFSHQSYWIHADVSSAVNQPLGLVTDYNLGSEPTSLLANHSTMEQRHARPKLTSEYCLPSTVTERQLVTILEDQLHVSPIGIDDNFFELGGHSLLATQVLDRIYRVFGVQLPIETIFVQPSVRQMASLIEPGGEAASKNVPIDDLFQELAAMTSSTMFTKEDKHDEKGGGNASWDNQ